METKIAENIKYYRQQLDLTQAKLAEQICVGKNAVSNYEKGYRVPDIDTLCRIADIFDITLDDLVEWSEEE